MVGMGAYSAGSKMPTVLSAPAPTVRCSRFHREGEDPVLRWALIQAPPSKHLEHLAAGELADRSGCRLAVDTGTACHVAGAELLLFPASQPGSDLTDSDKTADLA